MGIRVRKLLGYGLTDVKAGEGREVDERINWDSPGLTFTAPPASDYRDWLEVNREAGVIETDVELSLLREPEPGERRIDLDSAVVHDGEFGLPDVLVICPPTYRQWSRCDDAIDYIEETYLRKPIEEPQVNHVETLRHGIYPFVSYMDTRTGERVDDKIFNWIRATNAAEKVDEGELDSLARDAGFDSSREAWQTVAPLVPNDVRNIARFLDLFTSDEVWLQLRPVLYTYWA